MFELLTTDNWTQYLYNSNASTHPNKMPQSNSMPLSIIYYVFVLLIGSQFILNMFISVIISTFFREKETLNRNTLLTKLESDYIDACMQCYNFKPTIKYRSKGNPIRDKMYDIATSKKFDNLIFGCICVNMLLLCFSWYGNSKYQDYVIDVISKILLGIYILEFLIKIIAFGLAYFRDKWNLLDTSVVLAALIELLLELFSNQSGG